MSYEGREFLLCKSGHVNQVDVSQWCDMYGLCPCLAPYVLYASVDDTNGDGEEPGLLLETLAVFCSCPTCGHHHEIKPAIFRPEDPTQWRAIPPAPKEKS